MDNIDFSQEAINSKVKRNILEHPFSIFSISAGFLFLSAWVLLFHTPLVLVIFAGLLGLGIGSIFFNFFFNRYKFETSYILKINKAMEKQKNLIITRLKKELKKHKSIKSLKIYADQALIQFEKIDEKFNVFKKILIDKFESSEITYGRFLGTSEQLFLNVLDYLEKITNLLATISNIDEDYIKSRIKHLEELKEMEDADERELVTLKERMNIRKEQVSKVNTFLTNNEEIMTELDKSMSAINGLDTKLHRANVDIESARDELASLINTTKKFDEGVK